MAERTAAVRTAAVGVTTLIATLLAVAATLVPTAHTHAQTVVRGTRLNQYWGSETLQDGFAASRPLTHGHLRLGAQLHMDYAHDPLVAEREVDGRTEPFGSIVEHMATAQLWLNLALANRFTLFVGLPTHLWMTGEEVVGVPVPDGSRVGDPSIGARAHLYGDENAPFMVGLQLAMSLPTANWVDENQAYSGEQGITLYPELLLERSFGNLRINANMGARLRSETSEVLQVTVGHELTGVLGVAYPLLQDQITVHGEIFGAFGLQDASSAAQPMEALGGVKYLWKPEIVVGAAVTTGIQSGYGAPDVRGILTLAYQGPEMGDPLHYRDTDGDGIVDAKDQCPLVPEDLDNFEDRDGCPEDDNDQDGLLDSEDGCPNDPEDLDDFEDSNGCPDPDNDQDNVLDTLDQCPLVAEDRDGIADEDGCPEEDADEDTVLDPEDRCPLTPGIISEEHPDCAGCPSSACVSAGQSEIRIFERIEFETNEDRLLSASFHVLSDVLHIVQNNSHIRVIRVEGHTDSRADHDYNMDLSKRRALAVKRWLVKQGVNPSRLQAFGCGEMHPLADNLTSSGRQANRRVVFPIVDPAPTQAHISTGCVQASE